MPISTMVLSDFFGPVLGAGQALEDVPLVVGEAVAADQPRAGR